MSTGTYTARLTVTDNLGATASATVTITVSNAGSTNLRIITWNSQGGDGTDYVHDLDRQAANLAARNPDVIAMCESYQFSGGENQGQVLASRLTQRTGATWNYYWAPKFPGCEEGNLILTKWQVVSTTFQYLSYNRSVAQMTINVNGKVINFFATHLDDAASANRTQEAVELKNFMSGFAEPRFVAGDFNGGPDTSEIAQMVSSYFDSWNEAMNAGTASSYADNPVQWMTRTRRGRIDYVFYSRNASTVSLSNANIPDTRDMSRAASELLGTTDDFGVRPSDHNMVVVTFQVR
jgi:endonuclease/exonuclease/phosphatase family metal-dependent hydrolase